MKPALVRASTEVGAGPVNTEAIFSKFMECTRRSAPRLDDKAFELQL